MKLSEGDARGCLRVAPSGEGRQPGRFGWLPEPAQETGRSLAGLRSGPSAKPSETSRPRCRIDTGGGPVTTRRAETPYWRLSRRICSRYCSLAKIATSTRRFCAWPASVALEAIGSVSPRPAVRIRLDGTPCEIR
jgi:hypothetical protein